MLQNPQTIQFCITDFTFRVCTCIFSSSGMQQTQQSVQFYMTHITFRTLTCIFFKALGCNRPPNCPILPDPYYIPCTGCEPKEDDGLCCSSCQDINNVYNRYGRGNQDRRNRDRRGRSNRFIGSLTQSFNNGRYSRPTEKSA